MEEYKIKLEAFEGPLDLLMYLLDKNKIDIYDIPIAEITEQYIAYLNQFKEFEIEIASEFLVMAATLLKIKSKMLLPKPDLEDDLDEGDPRAELVARLLEYRRYKEVSVVLEDMAQKKSHIFSRKPKELAEVTLPLANLDIKELVQAFKNVLAANEPKKNALVAKEKFTVADKMGAIAELLEKRGRKIIFEEMFDGAYDKLEVIVTFMAMLELIRLGKITAEQKGAFTPIFISLVKQE
jgi:segregation and condensation protein A